MRLNYFSNFVKGIFFIVFFMFSFNLVSAKFVCGEVATTDSMSPSWYSVDVFRGINETSCLVSPEGSKYCCDLDSIDGYKWEVGDLWSAKIVNLETGYLARSVNVTLGAGSFDIFPEMNLEKVINLNEPSKKVYFDVSQIEYNISFLDLVESVKLNGEEISLENNSYFDLVNLSNGVNNLEVIAKVSEDEFSLNQDYGVISSYDFNREFTCEGCSKTKIRKNETVNVTLNLTLSDDLSGFIYREYIPSSFEVLSNLSLESENSEYNYLEFVMNSSNLSINYQVKSPTEYDSLYFASYLEDLFLGENEVVLYSKIKPISSGHKSKKATQDYLSNPTNVTLALDGRAVMSNSATMNAAIISEGDKTNAYLEVTEFGSDKNLFYQKYDFFEGYNIESNLGESFDKMVLDVKVPSSDFEVVGITQSGKKSKLTGYFVATDTYKIETDEVLKKVFVYNLKENPGIISLVSDFYFNSLINFENRFSFI